ncbi:hypothetical protein AYI69_g778 [Smittium culicis]|uniref:Uncharacterized protein n=1 Tax=Smittium culicis TaxID=133412 RepID=A0A1R1YSD8_9FUNG|nr:hypothetical protein AYI69_g778 [Smittium culicis]
MVSANQRTNNLDKSLQNFQKILQVKKIKRALALWRFKNIYYLARKVEKIHPYFFPGSENTNLQSIAKSFKSNGLGISQNVYKVADNTHRCYSNISNSPTYNYNTIPYSSSAFGNKTSLHTFDDEHLNLSHSESVTLSSPQTNHNLQFNNPKSNKRNRDFNTPRVAKGKIIKLPSKLSNLNSPQSILTLKKNINPQESLKAGKYCYKKSLLSSPVLPYYLNHPPSAVKKSAFKKERNSSIKKYSILCKKVSKKFIKKYNVNHNIHYSSLTQKGIPTTPTPTRTKLTKFVSNPEKYVVKTNNQINLEHELDKSPSGSVYFEKLSIKIPSSPAFSDFINFENDEKSNSVSTKPITYKINRLPNVNYIENTGASFLKSEIPRLSIEAPRNMPKMYQRYLNSFINKSHSDLVPKLSYKNSTKTNTTENSNELTKYVYSSTNSSNHISRPSSNGFLYCNEVFDKIPNDFEENLDIESTQLDENLIFKFEEISTRCQKSIKIDSLCDIFYSWADITNTLLNSREMMESKIEYNQISRIFKKFSQHIKVRNGFVGFNTNPQNSLHKQDLSELTNFNFSNLAQTTEVSKIAKESILYSDHIRDFDNVYNHSSFHSSNNSIKLPSPLSIGLGSNLNYYHSLQGDTFESNSRFMSAKIHGFMENLSQSYRFKLQNVAQLESFMQWKAKSSKLVNTLVNFALDGSDAFPLKKIHKYFHFWRRMAISLKLNRDQTNSFSSDAQSLQDHVSIAHELQDSYNDSVYINNYRQNISSNNRHINQRVSFSDNTDSIINHSINAGKSGDIPEGLLNDSINFNERVGHNGNLERLKAIEENSINSVPKPLSNKETTNIKNYTFYSDEHTLEKRNLSISDSKDRIILDIVKSSINIIKTEPGPGYMQLFHSNYVHEPSMSLYKNENLQLGLAKSINQRPIAFSNDIGANPGKTNNLNDNNNNLINTQTNEREFEDIHKAEKHLTISKEKSDVLDDNEIVIEPDFFSNRRVMRICFLFWIHRSSRSNLIQALDILAHS